MPGSHCRSNTALSALLGFPLFKWCREPGPSGAMYQDRLYFAIFPQVALDMFFGWEGSRPITLASHVGERHDLIWGHHFTFFIHTIDSSYPWGLCPRAKQGQKANWKMALMFR